MVIETSKLLENFKYDTDNSLSNFASCCPIICTISLNAEMVMNARFFDVKRFYFGKKTDLTNYGKIAHYLAPTGIISVP